MIIYTQFWRAITFVQITHMTQYKRAEPSKIGHRAKSVVEPHFGHPLHLAMNNNFVCLTSFLFQVSLTWPNTKWMEWPPLFSVPYVLVWPCNVTMSNVRTDSGQGKPILDSIASLHGQLLLYYKIGLLATIRNVYQKTLTQQQYGTSCMASTTLSLDMYHIHKKCMGQASLSFHIP